MPPNTPPKQVVMSHFGRSGSTVLAQLLRNHSQIEWLDEFFSLKWIHAAAKSDYDYSLQALLDMIQTEVDKIHRKQPGAIVGHEIKLMNFLQNPSCDMMDYVKATADPAHFVHVVLRRRNTLQRICSVYKAAATKTYHIAGKADDYKRKTFRIDLDGALIDYDTGERAATFPELIEKSQRCEDELFAQYRALGIDYLELFYEDDIEGDPKQAFRKVVDYLGLPQEPAEFSLSKTSAGLKKDMVNYDELESAMKGSKFEWMLG